MGGAADLYYDPYVRALNVDPYPVFRRLRDEAPLYRNEQYDFYALSRYRDVETVLVDRTTYPSGHGNVLEMIQMHAVAPKGWFIAEDDPLHRVHRGIVSRVFTPKAMNALEQQIRDYCARCLDPLVGSGGFDFARDIGADVPMRVISMLLGIPEDGQVRVRDASHESLTVEPGEQLRYDELDLDAPEGNALAEIMSGALFADYVDWRVEHPSDDLMTTLIQAEFTDETGTTRRLTRQEILTFTGLLAVAGNETTGRWIAQCGKLLADHTDQRRELVEDPSLIPNAIEEVLRYDSPSQHTARYVARDAEWYGETVPAGSIVLILKGSANRDDRVFPDPDRFDIHREITQLMSFGFGAHFCLGAPLARLEARVTLEEILKRFPTWEVDVDNAALAVTSTVRGWDTLPVTIP